MCALECRQFFDARASGIREQRFDARVCRVLQVGDRSKLVFWFFFFFCKGVCRRSFTLHLDHFSLFTPSILLFQVQAKEQLTMFRLYFFFFV